MKNWFLAAMSFAILSGCASAQYPKISFETSVPFSYSNSITVRNSAGENVQIAPQSLGDGFVAKYALGEEKTWRTFWLLPEKIPVRLLRLNFGETATIPLRPNPTNRTIRVPFAVRVLENGKTLGSYSYRVSVRPGQNNNFEFNFGPRELQRLKKGFTGYQGSNGYW